MTDRSSGYAKEAQDLDIPFEHECVFCGTGFFGPTDGFCPRCLKNLDRSDEENRAIVDAALERMKRRDEEQMEYRGG